MAKEAAAPVDSRKPRRVTFIVVWHVYTSNGPESVDYLNLNESTGYYVQARAPLRAPRRSVWRWAVSHRTGSARVRSAGRGLHPLLTPSSARERRHSPGDHGCADVRMVQRRQGPGFACEPREPVVV